MTSSPPASKPEPSFAEFVAMMAACMALMALGVDTMLPALPQMGIDLKADSQNHLQWIIVAYFSGAGVGQLFFGTLSDWLGRRRVLIAGVLAYVVMSLAAAAASALPAMIALRFLQGVAASSANVIPRSIVRDRYVGSTMAKVTSMIYVVFLMVPVMAPSLGQLILFVLPWRAIFLLFAAAGIVVALWMWRRLPETLMPEHRSAPNPRHLAHVFLFVIKERTSFYYILAITLMTASVVTYLSLMPQIFDESFKTPTLLGPVFAGCAVGMALGSTLNARIVERFGSRRISHIALSVFTITAIIHWVWAMTGHENLISFIIFQTLTMACMSLSTSNFAAIAMEKVGHVAGTAASLQGVTSMVGGALIGSFIGQHWIGDVALLPLGAALCGAVALGLVCLAEKGRLYGRGMAA
ncbi:multidrug effflux MFS transporter [Asticcacaulis machinosus]|uniref:Bcr/CflA family efflux transporter n=1 Tax=Asticcacaulis machinosus TaxID=2984211 RepID=A0ABT5HK57_9CAUL|nr:multidrug effflux MFS transporter [Asticcacaulis machinosus]MDC7676572.1 multidrug effflux MFS transporter [Asticcacaulis machinosus]